MKFAVFASLLVASLSAPALAADWVLVSTNAREDTFYIDSKSVRTASNGYKRALELTVYRQSDKFGDTSSQELVEYDCSGGRRRVLRSAFFSGQRITASGPGDAKWITHEFNSSGQNILKFVC